MNIKFEVWDKKNQGSIYPDSITFHRYGPFAFEVFTEEGKILGTDKDFELIKVSLAEQRS